jgi:hypothetical protein
MNTWLFHADPADYNIEEEVPSQLVSGKTEDWRSWVFHGDMQDRDRVILWQSGKKGGVYALGELAGTPYKAAGEIRVAVRYRELLKQPVFKGELRRHPLLRNLAILKMPNGKNPCRVRNEEWLALKNLIDNDALNIFTPYGQKEDRFTNGLISLLELSRHSHAPLGKLFFTTLLGVNLAEEIKMFRVLRRIDGTADAELCGRDICIRFETKIESGTLRNDQIKDHLECLARSTEAAKILVLLTPDDGNSEYIRRFLHSKTAKAFCRKSKRHKVLHIEWKRVYKFLSDHFAEDDASVFTRLVHQFLRQIHDRIFDQDFAGVIQKIAFGKRSEVYPDTYLDEIKQWSEWNTPREYAKLNGTGRKLLLYDSQRKAITVEVEIERVGKTQRQGSFPIQNIFVRNTLRTNEQMIPLSRILRVPGFENFNRGMAAAWNVTQEQYKQLMEAVHEQKTVG